MLLGPPTEPGPTDLRHAARVRRIAALPDERIVRIELLPKRSGPPRDVFVELMGNQWNAVVVEAESRVVRHVLWSRQGARGLVVGGTYASPPGQPRSGVGGDLSLRRWREILMGDPPERRVRLMVSQVAWTSPLNAPTLLGRDLDAPEDERLAEGHRRWCALARGEGTPTLLELDDGPHPYPVALPGLEGREMASVLGAFEEAGRHRELGGAPSLVDPETARRLEEAAERAGRRVRQLEAELDALEDPAALRATGDLILARYREIPAGAGAAALTGFDGQTRQVELDPKLPAHENAARYYDRAGRVERAEKRLPRLVDEARKTATDLERLLGRARSGDASKEEILAVLPDRGTTPVGQGGPGAHPALPHVQELGRLGDPGGQRGEAQR